MPSLTANSRVVGADLDGNGFGDLITSYGLAPNARVIVYLNLP